MAIEIKKKDQQECIEMVKRSFNESLTFLRPKFIKYNEFYRIYRALRDDGKQNYAGRAKLFIPYVFSTIETIIPRLIGNKPKIEAVPREPNDVLNAKANSALFDYEWDMMEMKKILKSWVKQTLIYGMGVVKLYWNYDEEAGDDHPKAELVDLFDFYYDPNATSFKDCRYIVHRTEKCLEDLKANENYIIPKELVTKVTQDEYKIQRDAILGLTKPNDRDSKKVEVLEYWGEYDLGNGEEECLIVVANKEFLIRAEKTPFNHGIKPFVKMIDVEDPHSMEGIGEVEQLASLQYELNDVRNQRMDNVTLILNRMWKVVKTGDVDEDDLVSEAGKIIHVGDKDALEPILTPDVTASAYNEESLIKQDMQYVSGVNDYVAGNAGSSSQQGGTGSLNRTATGVMLMQEAGNARFKYKLDNIEDSLKDFGEQLLGLNQQFINKDIMLKITNMPGYDWAIVPEQEIKGQFDIQVEGGSTQPMNKSVRRAEARELLNTVIPLAQMGLPVDVQFYLNNLLESYDLPEAKKTNEQAAQQPPQIQNQMAGAGGGPSGSSTGSNQSPGASAVAGLSGPEFTGLPADTMSNTGNG